MSRRFTTILAVPFAIASLLLSACGPERASTAPSAPEAAEAPAAAPQEATPAAQPTPPTAPAAKEPAVPDQPATPAAPGAPYEVELFAYQTRDLAGEGGGAADAAGPKAIVLLVARGKHRSGGWKSELVELPMRIFPPQFELRTTPPAEGSMNIQMISPFTTAVWVRMDQPVESLKVRVGAELRDVKVEPAEKVKNAMPSGR